MKYETEMSAEVDIVITASGDLAVGYTQPNPPPEKSCK